MNIKKALKQKIGYYDKPSFSWIFYRLVYDIHHNKFKKEKKLFMHDQDIRKDEKKSNSKWEKIVEAIDELDDRYGIPRIIYNYLSQKAKETYRQIVKFCIKEKFNVNDIIKIVREKEIKFCEFQYLEAGKKMNTPKAEPLKIFGEEGSNLRSSKMKYSVKNMPSLQSSSKMLRMISLKPSLLEDKKEEDEIDEDDEEMKKKNAMRRYTNIFIGNVDFHALNKKNQQIKIFEGHYCKTFLLVDKAAARSSKLEVKSFSPNSPGKNPQSDQSNKSTRNLVRSANLKGSAKSIFQSPLSKANNSQILLKNNQKDYFSFTVNKPKITIPSLGKNNFSSSSMRGNSDSSRLINSVNSRKPDLLIPNLKKLNVKGNYQTIQSSRIRNVNSISKFPDIEDKFSNVRDLETKYGWNLKTLRVKDCI